MRRKHWPVTPPDGRDAGRNQRDSLRSWTVNVIEHLLLLQYSPARAPRAGWIAEIVTWRRHRPSPQQRAPRRPQAPGAPSLRGSAHRSAEEARRPRRGRHRRPFPRALPLHARPGARRLLAANFRRGLSALVRNGTASKLYEHDFYASRIVLRRPRCRH